MMVQTSPEVMKALSDIVFTAQGRTFKKPMQSILFHTRWLMAALLAGLLVACGGGGGGGAGGSSSSGGGSSATTGLEARSLPADFLTRRAVNYSPFRTLANEAGLAAEAIPVANIRQDLDLMMAAGFRLIRLFDSSNKVARQILEVIRDNNLDMKVQLGAYVIGGNEAANQAELARTVALANEFRTIVWAVSVGNETMVCPRRPNFDPPCRLNFDQGLVAGIA